MASKGRDAALLLYRNILRAHKRYLPTEMGLLGDAYVKSEFKLHKSATNTAQLDQFFVGWEEYLDQIRQTGRRKDSVSAGSLDEKGMADTSFGRNLSSDVQLSNEQRSQLEKLRDETSQPNS
jgi:hypothetical protein